MQSREIYPKDFISDTLVEKIGKIIHVDAYLSFLMICSGIEFLGKCIDLEHSWEDRERGLSEKQFKEAIISLFPSGYHVLADDLYKDLRCGLIHKFTPGSISLTENRNDHNGEITYKQHPYTKNEKKTLLLEYFYFDFVEACKKVLSMDFVKNDKMSKPILSVG